MSRAETGNECWATNQVTIFLLLLAMVLMRDSIDNELIQAVCLACLLSLIISEVEMNRDTDPISDMRSNPATAADSSDEYFPSDIGPSSEVLEDSDAESTPYSDDDEIEAGKSPAHQKTASDISTRRPIEAYSSMTSGTETTHNQGITWKPMPPKSIVPTKHLPNKDSQSLSIRFVP